MCGGQGAVERHTQTLGQQTLGKALTDGGRTDGVALLGDFFLHLVFVSHRLFD